VRRGQRPEIWQRQFLDLAEVEIESASRFMHAAARWRTKGDLLSRREVEVGLKLHVVRPKQIAQHKIIVRRLEVSLCGKDSGVHVRCAKRHPLRERLSAIDGIDVDRNKRREHPTS